MVNLQQELNTQKLNYQSLQKGYDGLQDQEEMILELNKTLTLLRNDLDTKVEDITELKLEINRLKKELNEAKTQASQYQDQLHTLQQKVMNDLVLQQQQQEQESYIHNLEKENQRWQTEYSNLQQAYDSLLSKDSGSGLSQVLHEDDDNYSVFKPLLLNKHRTFNALDNEYTKRHSVSHSGSTHASDMFDKSKGSHHRNSISFGPSEKSGPFFVTHGEPKPRHSIASMVSSDLNKHMSVDERSESLIADSEVSSDYEHGDNINLDFDLEEKENLSQLQSKYNDLNDQYDGLSNDYAIVKKKRDTLQATLKQAKADAEKLQSDNATLKSTNQDLQQKLKNQSSPSADTPPSGVKLFLGFTCFGFLALNVVQYVAYRRKKCVSPTSENSASAGAVERKKEVNISFYPVHRKRKS